MLRTHNCGELGIKDVKSNVTLCGWAQKIRDKGKIIWIDLRDRYGITQLMFEEDSSDKNTFDIAKKCGREYVIKVSGEVSERISKNPNISTGDIEIKVSEMEYLNVSEVPPFTIEDETDGGEDLRMKYRYLDLRRSPLQKNIFLRHKLMSETRNYLNSQEFIEIETPVLIKSTPEGARDFIVPSRMNQGEYYALPQSPQTFKQLLMVSGYDKYYQLVKCFRDEDLRADRQPEFTQIDCEMSFVTREDVLKSFGKLINHLFNEVLKTDIGEIPIMQYDEAINSYGSDKPDLRFGMRFRDISSIVQGNGFKVFDDSEVILSIKVKGASSYSRKELDELTNFVKKPQIGSKGLVYIKCNEDGSFKSSVDKFYTQEILNDIANVNNAKKNDLILILAGEKSQTFSAMSSLRILMGDRLGLRDPNNFKPIWIVDFPMFSYDKESNDYHAMHHPFTSPISSDTKLLDSEPIKAKANAYDLVINGVEIGGGSIRIHQRILQEKVFKILGFSSKEANDQFGFLLNAFRYGTPPHGGIAFGFDRLCALFAGKESIRDFIAFPKNTSGRDTMIDSPSAIDEDQLKELGL
ncbi:MAG: aspartate--tRNA ligase [Cytophagales bacterium]|jgi:aspartyl-tRNA synthetase|nr:MAG: aspartate--tRNA ligase [Rhodothermaeota bacterium MED-G19]|tara:strand:+ start:680 stop:2416 length:1737 start_codon:yes stop_codon:yes gene_type:complete